MQPFLLLLFFVEMWERFSYAGMRTLLVPFLTQHLGMTDEHAYALYSVFSAFGYTAPILGGYIADNFLGFRKMVYIGGTILLLGHIFMALEVLHPNFLYLGLGSISVGTGCFKGNIFNLLGSCYSKNDPQRIRGFSLFYVGINLGTAFASVACSIVSTFFGWHIAFGTAAFGLFIGLLTFKLLGNKVLGKDIKPPQKYKTIFCLIALMAGLSGFLVQKHSLSINLILISTFLAIIYIAKVMISLDRKERQNIKALLTLLFFFIAFFAVVMHLASLINLFTLRNIDRTFFSMEIPATLFQAVDAFVIILFGPFLARFFTKLAPEHHIWRVGVSILFVVLCFLILFLGCSLAGATGKVHCGFLIVALTFIGMGEICIGPFVQNCFTVLSPERLKGFMMGFLFLGVAYANLTGIVISRFMAVPKGAFSPLVSLGIYKQGFLMIAYAYMVVIALFLIFLFYKKRLRLV